MGPLEWKLNKESRENFYCVTDGICNLGQNDNLTNSHDNLTNSHDNPTNSQDNLTNRHDNLTNIHLLSPLKNSYINTQKVKDSVICSESVDEF